MLKQHAQWKLRFISLYLWLWFSWNNATSTHNRCFMSSLCAYYVIFFVLYYIISRIPRSYISMSIDPISCYDVLSMRKKLLFCRYWEFCDIAFECKIDNRRTWTKYFGIHSCPKLFRSLARSLCASSSPVFASVAAAWSSLLMACVTAYHNFSLSHGPWCSRGTVYFFNLFWRTSGVGLKNTLSCCKIEKKIYIYIR